MEDRTAALGDAAAAQGTPSATAGRSLLSPDERAFVGRDEEVATIDRFLSAPEDLPAALIWTGEAGIGKTRLWQVGVEAARSREYNLLSK